MLLITSNWGLTDGSLAPSRAARAAGWLQAIRRAVARAGRGRDGRYRPVAAATLVFAGDTCDWLLSEVWAGRDRPWHVSRRSAEARVAVASATLRLAAPAVRLLCRWARRGLDVPAADGHGRPTVAARATAALRGVLLAGDRDWWLTDRAVDSGRLGLLVGDEWSDGLRHVRHGHDLDPLAHARGSATARLERAPTLAESLVVDLVVPFAVAARAEPPLWAAVRPLLGRLAADRPSAMPACLGAMIQRVPAEAAAGDRDRLASLWRRHVARWHAVAGRDMPACEAEFDALGDLAAWLERLEPAAVPPAAVRQLDGPAAITPGPGLVVAHFPTAGGPSLACHGPVGTAWREPLDAAAAAPAIVAVGAGDAGNGFVDAA